MQHTEPFEYELLMSSEDHLKLVKIGKIIVNSIISLGTILLGIVVYI